MPKITKLKLYKGFEIYKFQSFDNSGEAIHWYEAYLSEYGEVKEYVDECSTLAECKRVIDSLLQERLYEEIK